ncbi:MAG: YcxB family protein [Bacteroidota bacterium]
MDKISVSQSLSQDEFVRYSLYRYFKRPLILFLYTFIFILAVALFLSGGISEASATLLPLLAVMALLPIFIYLSARSIYKSSYAIQSTVHYEFSDTEIRASAEKFSFNQSWDLVYRVEESKSWFMIFTNRVNAIYLKKESFEDVADLEVLKSLIRSKSHIKQKLRK